MQIDIYRRPAEIRITTSDLPGVAYDQIGRTAVFDYAVGRMQIIQAPDWADWIVMAVEGHPLTRKAIQDMLDEIAELGVDPDPPIVRLHRDESALMPLTI